MNEFPPEPPPDAAPPDFGAPEEAAFGSGALRLPSSLEAEREVLAAVLVDPEAMDAILEAMIQPEDFHAPRHTMIFETLRALYDANAAIDEVTIQQHMKDAGSWEKFGGARALLQLLDRSGTTAHIAEYCKIVKDKSTVRQMITAARAIEANGLRAGDEVAGFLDEAERSIFSVLERQMTKDLRPIAEVVKNAITEIAAAYDSDGHITGIGTGFRDLDKLTHGLQRGDLIILAARPAMGKTSFVLNLASNAALKHNASVAVFSLEMPATQLAQRLLAAEARVDLSRLRGGFLSQEDWPRLTNSANELSQARIFIDDTPGITPAAVRAKCRRVARKQGLDLIVIDYLQLMSGGGKHQSREQEISYISRTLKGLAKDLSCPVLALSQLNRGPETRTDHRPMMSDLRESGAIEQDADLVGFIYRDEVYNKDLDEAERGIAELIIGKHRNGPTGTVKLKFWKSWTKFDNLAPEHGGGFGG